LSRLLTIRTDVVVAQLRQHGELAVDLVFEDARAALVRDAQRASEHDVDPR
jgi:hypothetical protein